MLDFRNLPIFKIDPRRERESKERVWRRAFRDGYSARACQVSIEGCPPFQDTDMIFQWKRGWRRHQDEQEALKKGKTLWPLDWSQYR